MDAVQQSPAQSVVNLDASFAFPLTSAQMRLWFLDQLAPDKSAYLIPWAIRMRGPLDAAALRASLNEIAQRHEVFRTRFVATGGEPVQLVMPRVHLPLHEVDLSALDPADAERQARSLAREEAETPISLQDGPLLRTQLLRLATQDHVLLLTTHHICFDGWSRSILVRELGRFYDGFVQGQPVELPELPIQYGDFAVWQQEHLSGAFIDDQLQYWKNQLKDLPLSIEVPTDRARPAVQTSHGVSQPFVLSYALTEKVKWLSQREGVTPYMMLLAAFQTLLARYSGQGDVVVGTPVANRNRPELEGIIGLFANTLVLRTRLDGDPTFRELLGRVKETALSAYAHEEMPFEQLVQELRPERSLSHSPLFQILFSLRNTPSSRFYLGGMQLEWFTGAGESSKYDISMYLEEHPDGYHGKLEYNTDLYDATTIQRILNHFETLLESAIEAPYRRLSELEMLGAEERRQLLVEWNDTARDYPRELCVHQLFEQQVERRGQATAVEFGDQKITYAELNRQANLLAHLLIAQGIGVGQRVGLFVGRSLAMFVGLLGIQKSGAAYVPLDPAYPAERVKTTLEAAGVTLLVTQEVLLSALPEYTGGVVCLDRDHALLERQSAGNPASGVTPDDLVYVIFTSGSTGKPKGVELGHRGVVNLLDWMKEELHFTERGVFPALASFAFDMSIPELYLALSVGGTVALAPKQLAADGEELARFLKRHSATLVHATPTTWNLLLEAGFTGQNITRCIGAEPLPAELFGRLMDAAPGTPLYNFYGPTETTVWSTFQRLDTSADRITIGRPLANTQIYIVDRDGNPALIGVPGELLIGGDGVAKGYLNQADLTAEKFIPDSFSKNPGGRLYRTGDLGRYLADGRVEFAGRVDHQVKIRGFRIELGEIETVLSQALSVRESVVMAREDEAGDKRLVAYVVAQTGVVAEPRELREWVKQRLPDYMVPSSFVVLERMPLSPNGKVDRKALPAPAREEAATAAAMANPVEEIIANVWAEVLKTAEITPASHFFELGGHSLLATKAVARIRQALRVNLPLSAIFDAPTVAGLAVRVQTLLREDANPAPLPLLAAHWGDVPKPLSFSQQRLWFLDQLEPNSSFYNVPLALRLSGPLDDRAMEQALAALVARHDTLRTTLELQGEHPVQVVAREMALPLVRIDLTGLAEGEREAEALRVVSEAARQPFDLARGPLFRATLVKLGAEEHVLLACLHHAISDGWSLGVLVNDVTALYEAIRLGAAPQLPALGITYGDYAVWQRKYLEEGALERQLGYWKQQMAGAPPSIELPTDRVRPPVQSFRGAKQVAFFPKPLLDGLKALSRAEGATLFSTLLAGFDVLLARYSGQQDIVVGTASAGRGQQETERLIGYFVNTLVLRTRLEDEPTFRELIRRVRDTTLDAFANQDIPFEKLVEELNPVRDTSRSPLFQVMMIQQNAFERSNSFGELRGTPYALPGGSSKVDLLLNVSDVDGQLRCGLEYNTDLYDGTTIDRMLECFRVLLEDAVAEPSRRVSEIALLTAERRQQMLVEWNATAADYPRTRCVQELIEEQVVRTPDDIACISGETVLTYTQLNGRANQLAHFLLARGIGPGTLVGICLNRTPDLLVALLGILKTGAAYLPLDPTYPRERLGYILEDARARLVLTEQAVEQFLPEFEGERLSLDAHWSAIELHSRENPLPAGRPDDLAYVLHTSGSTGKPKGVEISQRNLVNFLCSMQQEPGLAADDKLLAVTTLSFDIAGLELYLPLVTGASVILASRADASSPTALMELMERWNVTVMQATPATWLMLFEAGWQGHPGLKILCGGEALAPELAAKLTASCAELWNMYGPTETTIWSSVSRIEAAGLGQITIGHPIANTTMYVLDPHRRLVPIGVSGELYIGGDGVARGYWRKPELTAERFVPDPFTPGARMYRTGDVARFLPGGDIQCVGRVDHQVKIRGFRIELGEIETVLSQALSVRESVVMAREDEAGDKRLVAYVVAQTGVVAEPRELREWVKQRLPDYMVPTSFVVLERMPLSPNGKVDRKALPAPAREETATAAAMANPVEEIVANVWAEVLKTAEITPGSNFFELGGHSLLATKAVARIRQALRVDLPLSAIFDAPTVAGLAVRVQTLLREDANPAPLPLLAAHWGDVPKPLSFSQQRLWFLDQLEPNSSFYNVPLALRLSGPLDDRAMEQALAALVARHDTLRTTLELRGEHPVQVVAREMALPLVRIDLTGLAEAEREAEALRVVGEAARQPFDLARGPLFRATLVKLGAEEHVLLACLHHAISDGWSLGVLVNDVTALYEALRVGAAPQLPALGITYGDYAVWQRKYLEEGALERQLGYWKQQMAGAPPSIELPTDRVRPPVQSFRGAKQVAFFPKPLLDGLKALSRAEGATLFSTLLAGFDVLLARYSGQQDIVVGTASAGRGQQETERLIGYFVNTLVLRTSVADEPTFRELIRRVRDTTLDAFANQDIPFEKLVEELNPVRDTSRSPLFQVMMIQQNAFERSNSFGELRGTPYALPGGSSKVDLLLNVSDVEGQLRCGLEYNTDLYDGTTIDRMLESFRVLLEDAVAEPSRRVSEIALLTAERRQQMLVEWNATAADYPRTRCVQELIEEQVVRTPDDIACISGETVLTYTELNERANQLAHFLLARGIGPGMLVGICLNRTPDLLVALLAILKTGAAYLPLDPTYPRERLGYILEDARARLVLTEQAVEQFLPEFDGERLSLDAHWSAIELHSKENPLPAGRPDDLAYVLHTSGSTGKPKGVEISQRNLVNFLCSMQQEPGLAADDKLLAVTTLSFDIAGLELYLPLVTGASVILASRADASSPTALMELMERWNVTVMQATPATWLMLFEAGWQGHPGLKILCGGEALAPELAAKLTASCAELWNMYGPTETTIWSSVSRIEAAGLGQITIGHPIANTTMYVLDPHRRLVPIGVSGELYIGGDGVARGYWRKPELTAERFVPDPFTPGARMYRTGDVARFLPGGDIQCVGRVDHQVKIRGFRIELGEIETVLSQDRSVRESVVMAREDEAGDKRLVAYVVAQTGVVAEPRELREWVKQRLPDYMVPTSFVVLERMPLSPNGKVDRKALPAPDARPLKTTTAGDMPQTPVEVQLASIWEDLLQVSPIRLSDDFFELGGHSMLAVQMMNRAKEVFGCELSPTLLFGAPRLGDLANVIQTERGKQPFKTLIPIRKTGTKPPLFCVSRPNVNALGFLFLARRLSPDQPVFGLQSQMEKDGRTWAYEQSDYEDRAREYIKALREAYPEGPYLLTGYCEGAHIAFEMARQLEAMNLPVGMLGILDAWPVENTVSKAKYIVRSYWREIRKFRRMKLSDKLHKLTRGIFRPAKKAVDSGSATVRQGDAEQADQRRLIAQQVEKRYWPGPDFVPTTFSGRLTLFRTPRQLRVRINDYKMGWGQRALGGVDVYSIDTGHTYLLREPSVADLAMHMQRVIDNVLAEHARVKDRTPRGAEVPDAPLDASHVDSGSVAVDSVHSGS